VRHAPETPGDEPQSPTLDNTMHTRIHACMATKTISIDLEAYERLRRARRLPNESFSKVIKRAEWPVQPRTAGALLSAMAKIAPVDKEVIDRLDTAQGLDRPPEDPWRAD
jgi:predicted CopG family antitoxin